MLEYILLPETKLAQTYRADVVVVDTTPSGLHPLRWFRRVQSATPNWNNSDYIFVDEDGSLWSSKSFRHQFLYPCLTRLQQKGDPYLQGDIPSLFWSLHCYRRGACTHVDRAILKRKASLPQRSVKAMIYEHGRWRRHPTSHPIDVVYRDWSPRDRILLTQLFF